MNTATALPTAAAAAPFAIASAPMAVRPGGSLARHVQQCARARGRWFTVRRAAESVHAAVGPRFFTTILVASGLICLLVEWV